ncbi:MAG: phage integrase N-terminal domain-containing protein [Hydrogenobaculum sp.]
MQKEIIELNKENLGVMPIRKAVKSILWYAKQGIGMSKRKIQYSNKERYTPFIHSFTTLTRYAGIMKEFADDMKAKGIRNLNSVKYEDVKSWLEVKASKYTERTLKVNMCALEKLFSIAGKEDIAKSINRDFTEIYSKAKPSGRVEPFVNPQGIIDRLKEKSEKAKTKLEREMYAKAWAWASLQYLTGARVGDIKKLYVDGTKVVIPRSKGGKTRTIDFSDNKERLERVKDVLRYLSFEFENKDVNDNSTFRHYYEKVLRDTAASLGEKWTGSHAFRVNYAIERFEEIRQSKSEFEADQQLTRELGHERISMSQYYRKA